MWPGRVALAAAFYELLSSSTWLIGHQQHQSKWKHIIHRRQDQQQQQQQQQQQLAAETLKATAAGSGGIRAHLQSAEGNSCMTNGGLGSALSVEEGK